MSTIVIVSPGSNVSLTHYNALIGLVFLLSFVLEKAALRSVIAFMIMSCGVSVGCLIVFW